MPPSVPSPAWASTWEPRSSSSTRFVHPLLPQKPLGPIFVHSPVCPALGDLTSTSPQGYEGLVEGGDNIKQATWLSVSNIIQLVSLARRPSP